MPSRNAMEETPVKSEGDPRRAGGCACAGEAMREQAQEAAGVHSPGGGNASTVASSGCCGSGECCGGSPASHDAARKEADPSLTAEHAPLLDGFDQLLFLEQTFIREGIEQGTADGAKQGAFEGRRLGVSQGYSLGKEVTLCSPSLSLRLRLRG